MKNIFLYLFILYFYQRLFQFNLVVITITYNNFLLCVYKDSINSAKWERVGTSSGDA